MDKEIEIIVDGLNKMGKSSYHILDLGCGTGFTVLKLYKNNNFNIDAVDISKKMLEVMKRKINNASNVNIFLMEAGEFLNYATSNNKRYDLIIFSTILHHLYDYMKILRLSLPLLNSAGYIYILNEPFKKINLVEIVDTFLHRLFRCRKNLHYSILNALFRSKRVFSSKYSKAIAEYHFYRGGVDIDNILNLLKQNDIKIIKERRYMLSNFRFTYNLTQRLKRFNNHIALTGKKCNDPH